MNRDSMALASGRQRSEEYPAEWATARDAVGGRQPQSPLALAQEMVTTDWQVVVASLLHVRTRRAQGHPALWQVLRIAPSPRHLTAPANQLALALALRSCGFANRRLHAFKVASVQWRNGRRPTEPGEVFGCGDYICDSYRLFVDGDLRRGFQDGELGAYALWCMRMRREGLPYRLEYEQAPSDLGGVSWNS